MSLNDKASKKIEIVNDDESNEQMNKEMTEAVTNAWSGKEITKENKALVRLFLIIVYKVS